MFKSLYFEKLKLDFIFDASFLDIVDFIKKVNVEKKSRVEKINLFYDFVKRRYQKISHNKVKFLSLMKEKEISSFISPKTFVQKYPNSKFYFTDEDYEPYLILLTYLDDLISKFPNIKWNKKIIQNLVFESINKYFEFNGLKTDENLKDKVNISCLKHSGEDDEMARIILIHNLLYFLAFKTKIQFYINRNEEVLKIVFVNQL